MRKFALAVVATPCLLLAYACVDDPDPSGEPIPGFDASPQLPDSSPLPDLLDAGSDAPTEGPVTVAIVNVDGEPLANASVVFYDGDAGATALQTGADGRATHIMFPGGSITAHVTADGGKSQDAWWTVLSVAPGDVIHLGHPYGMEQPVELPVRGTVQAPPAAIVGVDRLDFDFGDCPWTGSFDGDAIYVDVARGCLDSAGNLTALFIARGEDDAPLAFAAKTAPSSDAGPIEFNVATADWQAAVPRQITFANPPAWATNLWEETYFPRAGRLYHSRYYERGTTAPIDPVPFVQPPAALTPHFLHWTELYGTQERLSFTSWRLRRTPVSADLPQDLGTFLPRVQTFTVEGTGTSPTVGVTFDGTGPTNATALARLDGFGQDDGGSEHHTRWNIVGPSTGNVALAPPPFPTELAGFTVESWTPYSVVVVQSAQVPYPLARQAAALLDDTPWSLRTVHPDVAFDIRGTEARGNFGPVLVK